MPAPRVKREWQVIATARCADGDKTVVGRCYGSVRKAEEAAAELRTKGLKAHVQATRLSL